MTLSHKQFTDYINGSNPAELALLKEGVALANQQGWSADEMQAALRWVKNNGAKYSGNPERAMQSFKAEMDQGGVGHVADKLIEWRGVVAEHGVLERFSAEEAPATADKQGAAEISPAAAARLKEIRAERRAGGNPDPNEEIALLDGEPVRAKPNRMHEIRRMRREDPDKYNADPEIAREELALIEASIAPQHAADASAPAAAPSGAGNAIEQ